MDDDLHDDFFEDDVDLDDLPANALDELEERAFLSTQARALVPPDVTNSSDYGLEDEDVINLDAQQHRNHGNHGADPGDEVTQREQWRLQRYGQVNQTEQRRFAQNNELDQQQDAWNNAPGTAVFAQRPRTQHAQTNDPHGNSRRPPDHGIDVTALQARILELEEDRIVLKKSAEDAKSMALVKAGEIAIIRANQEKTTKEHERRLATIHQSHSVELAKQKADLELARKDREKIETNNRFLEHDLAHGAERAGAPKRTLTVGNGNAVRGKAPAQPSPLSTPRKDRHLPFRDGFEDDEVVTISPSKSKTASRPTTPKGGIKRKRASNTEQSPSPAHMLALADLEPSPQADTTTNPNPTGTVLSVQHASDSAAEKFELMQCVLNHRVEPARERTVEFLTRYRLPSLSSRSLSSLLYDHLTHVSSDQGIDAFRADLCNFLINLWSKCLEDKYYAPVYDLTEMIQYVLIISPSSSLIDLMPGIVPLCLKTADLIALPTAKASKSRSLLDAPTEEFQQQIDPLDYLSFLHHIALQCYSSINSLAIFWSAMEFDFVLLMLHKAQPVSQIIQMLELLGTSILPSSFGAITTRVTSQQPKNESDTLDRLTILLFETPQPPLEKTPYTPLEIASLRTAVLCLLQSLAYTPYGGKLLAIHRLAIGRLVRFLHEAILAMYMYNPTTHSATVTHVNATVYILAHLTSAHADVVDMRAKLAVVPGGSQKHLASLSRVAFAEGYTVLEKGIEGEAAEAAHRMLDELLSPEEGEAVVDVFSSAR